MLHYVSKLNLKLKQTYLSNCLDLVLTDQSKSS